MSHADAFDGFAIDLDGVVWLAGAPIDGSPEAVAELRRAGHAVAFVTNDPGRTRTQTAALLAEVGIDASAADVVTSAAAVADVLRSELGRAAVFVIGPAALREELESSGLKVVDANDRPVDAVVVGGHSGFDYDELSAATSAVRAGAPLWATGRDAAYPTPGGLVPGTGALVAAVETAAETQARVGGKPEPPMFEAAKRRLGGARMAMVGDTLDADIAGAQRAGLATILVLSGRTGPEDLVRSTIRPDLVLPDLAALCA
jgi:phosphoglycolate/pyridoxal phosphate phosphatase family enzyme